MKKSISDDDTWDEIFQTVISRYQDTKENIRDYRGGEVNETYIRDYYNVSLSRFRFVCNLITTSLPPGSAVLEVGPGYGFILLFLKKKGYIVTGAELKENIAAYAQAMIYADIPVFAYDIQQNPCTPGDLQYDLVIASEVLEHLYVNLQTSLRRLYPLCRDGGLIIVTVPNIYRLESYLKILKRENICDDFPDVPETNTGPLTDLRTHPREPAMKEVLRAFDTLDLEIILSGYFSSSLRIKHPLIASILPTSMREHIFVLGRKKSGSVKVL